MKAKIYTYTIVKSTSKAFADKVPYVVGLLEDDRGERFTSYIDGYKEEMEVTIGMTVECSQDAETGKYTCKFIN